MNEIKPLVSVIIRTCGRPEVLKNAIESVKQQCYSSIETVIVEDGENISETYIKERFPDMNIRYTCTGEKKGRCKAGNIGLGMAQGDYLNFLDDDDLLLPNHVKILMDKIEEENAKVAYAVAEEHQIRKDHAGKISVKRKFVRYKQPFNRLLLCSMNYFPIQSVMFAREVFLSCGGFDESLDVLEDWDLWLRYSMKNDFAFVNETTSIYYTPYKGKDKKKRDIQLKESGDIAVEKHKAYILQMDATEVNKEMDYILNVYNKKTIWFYLKKFRNFLMYRDI